MIYTTERKCLSTLISVKWHFQHEVQDVRKARCTKGSVTTMIKLTKNARNQIERLKQLANNSIKLQRMCLWHKAHFDISKASCSKLQQGSDYRMNPLIHSIMASSTAHAHFRSDDQRCEAQRKYSEASVFKSRGRTTVKSSLADTLPSIVIAFPCFRYAGKSPHSLIRTGFFQSGVPTFVSLESTFWC